MGMRTAAMLAASMTALLISATVALAGTLTVNPSHLSFSAPVGSTTQATVTFVNTGPQDVRIVNQFLTFKPYLTPNNQTQLSAFSFFSYCGERVLARGESCTATVVFQPGVYDHPGPEPGTVFHARLIVDTSMGRETVRITATAT